MIYEGAQREACHCTSSHSSTVLKVFLEAVCFLSSAFDVLSTPSPIQRALFNMLCCSICCTNALHAPPPHSGGCLVMIFD